MHGQSGAFYGRWLLAELLPKSIDRVVYLDVDILVQRDLHLLVSLSRSKLQLKECRTVESRMIPPNNDLCTTVNPEGAMCHPQYTITAQQVQLHTARLCQKHLRLADHGPKLLPRC